MEEAYKKVVQTAWKHRNIHKVISFGKTKWQAIVVPSTITNGEYNIFFMDVTSSQELLKDLLIVSTELTKQEKMKMAAMA
ncbi:hypothetical protein [Desulfitobacterium sp. PCE1]|uniref:hypothetical protein n=1 Tax=Desulfitobacterium sp. PCE1 TaxID=146907 RepID=UPI00037DC4CD|nr:hypothetical protein [Desulfitobacterium sp. PCE1]